MSEFSTIYIPSKGRPECRTAQTLTEIEYPDDWFIVCGDNDETLPEYQKAWGDRIIVFDWEREVQKTDLLDNFGYRTMPSGAAPARNAIADISFERGEIRHWQMDDDIASFRYFCEADGKKTYRRLWDGDRLSRYLLSLGKYADSCGASDVGIASGAMLFAEMAYKSFRTIIICHCLPSDPEKFVRWRSRVGDDLINLRDIGVRGGFALGFGFLAYCTPKPARTDRDNGGQSDLYKLGCARSVAYGVLVAASADSLIVKNGEERHRLNLHRFEPKIIQEKWAR